MGKSKELRTTTELVKQILEEQPKARNSDNFLYYLVCTVVGERKGIDVEDMSMTTFLLCLNEYGFPAFETVRRTRQKLQATYPELAADSDVECQRMLNEEVFREYAKGAV